MNQFNTGYPQPYPANYGGNPYYGQAFGNVPRPMAKYTQPLTEEEMKRLTQKTAIECWQVTDTDQLKAKCTHKRNGALTLVEDGERVRCTICGESFHMCDLNPENMVQITESMVDALQTIKAIYVDAPDSLIAQYFQILPLLKKAPDLWERAISNVKMYENGIGNVAPIAPGVSAFGLMNNMLANPYQFQQPQMMPPQPMYPGYAPQQQPYMAGPQYAPQPQMMPQYPQQPMQGAYPQQMGYDANMYQQNPFVYGGAPQMPPQPQMQTGAVPPPPMAPNPGVPAAPQQTQSTEEVVQHKTFTV